MLTDYMYQERREEKDSVDSSIQRHEDYKEQHKEGLITAIRNDSDNTKTNRITMTLHKYCYLLFSLLTDFMTRYLFGIWGAYDKFPDFFRMNTFIDSTHKKL